MWNMQCKSNRWTIAGFPGFGPRLVCPGQRAFPEDHEAIRQKQDEISWNKNRHSARELKGFAIEVVRLRANFRNVKPDLEPGDSFPQ